MKKLFTLAMIFATAGLIFSACNDDGGGSNPSRGTFLLNGSNYTVSQGWMEYYGAEYSTTAMNVDLYLGGNTGEAEIYLEMLVDDASNKLIAGTYNYDDSGDYAQFTIIEGYFMSPEGTYLNLTGGTAVVTVSGSRYNIVLNCVVEGGLSLTGTYNGYLDWSDETDV